MGYSSPIPRSRSRTPPQALNSTGENAKQPKCYVQEQTITMLATVSDSSDAHFAKPGRSRWFSTFEVHTTHRFFSLLMYSRLIVLLDYHAVVTECTMQCEWGGL